MVLIVVFLFLAQACGSSKGPFVPVEQTQAENPAMPREFILGAGDKIEIVVYRNDDLKRTIQIDLSGKASFPLVGDIQAAGLGIFEFRDKIRAGLSKYIVNPQVTVSVSSSQSQKIIVLGEVKNPGYFQADSDTTVLEAISRAGGNTTDATMKTVLLIRGGLQKPQLASLNLEKALKKGDLTQNIALQRGDIIYVPRTVIADVDQFFTQVSHILQPFLQVGTGVLIMHDIRTGGRVSISP